MTSSLSLPGLGSRSAIQDSRFASYRNIRICIVPKVERNPVSARKPGGTRSCIPPPRSRIHADSQLPRPRNLVPSMQLKVLHIVSPDPIGTRTQRVSAFPIDPPCEGPTLPFVKPRLSRCAATRGASASSMLSASSRDTVAYILQTPRIIFPPREPLLGGSGPEVERRWFREVLRDVDEEVVDGAGDEDVLELLSLQSESVEQSVRGKGRNARR